MDHRVILLQQQLDVKPMDHFAVHIQLLLLDIQLVAMDIFMLELDLLQTVRHTLLNVMDIQHPVHRDMELLTVVLMQHNVLQLE